MMKQLLLALSIISLAVAQWTPTTVQWGSCPFSTHAEYHQLVDRLKPTRSDSSPKQQEDSATSALLRLASASNGRYALQCANITAPLDWSGYTAGTINLWLTRINPANSVSPQHFWLVPGGPGESGESVLGIFNAWQFDVMQFFDNKVSIIAWDHRGTGLSSFLTCSRPMTSTYMRDCAVDLQQQLGGPQGLAQFSTTNAAIDLDYLIESSSVKEVGNNFVVYGASYGTYLVQRYMHVRTRDPLAMIIDGNIATDYPELVWMETTRDSVGKTLLTLCGQDTWCSALFSGKSAMMVLEEIYDRIDNNKQTCFNKLGTARAPYRATLQKYLGTLVESHHTRMLLLPIIYRLYRCDANDIIALNRTFSLLGADNKKDEIPAMSTFLWANIFVSELSQLNPADPLPVEDLARYEKKLLLSLHTLDSLAPVSQQWPRYATDKYYLQYPDVGTVPVLVLQGTMDTRTSFYWGVRLYANLIAQQKKKGITNPTVKFVAMDKCAHVAMLNSPMIGSAIPCGMYVVKSFINNPSAQPDTNCISQITPYDWSMTNAMSVNLCNQVFGTTNCYGF